MSPGKALAFVLSLLMLVTVALPARAAVTGVVRGTVTVDGAARAGASVTISGEGTTDTAVTDAQGRFTFPLVAFGTYTVIAHVLGQPDAQTIVNVTTGSVSDVALAIGAGNKIGRTTATTHGVAGNPVSVTTFSSAQITALPQNQNLNRLIATVPGIVQFSYDEPVAHGFHGVSYEIDGAPLPQTTSTNFAEAFDPRNIDSMEIFTGAFPAEFGGQRRAR